MVNEFLGTTSLDDVCIFVDTSSGLFDRTQYGINYPYIFPDGQRDPQPHSHGRSSPTSCNSTAARIRRIPPDRSTISPTTSPGCTRTTRSSSGSSGRSPARTTWTRSTSRASRAAPTTRTGASSSATRAPARRHLRRGHRQRRAGPVRRILRNRPALLHAVPRPHVRVLRAGFLEGHARSCASNWACGTRVIQPYYSLWSNMDVFDPSFYDPGKAVVQDPKTGYILQRRPRTTGS